VCGDGVVEHLEECDDGNLTDGDDCTSRCLLPRCSSLGITASEGGGEVIFNGTPYCLLKVEDGTSCDARCASVATAACDQGAMNALRDDMHAASQQELKAAFFDMSPGWYNEVDIWDNNAGFTGFSCNGGTAYVRDTPWGTDDGSCHRPVIPGTLSCSETNHDGVHNWGHGSVCRCGN
jgi:cysteine-rich repeat protein